MAEPDEFGARAVPHVLINKFRETAPYEYPARKQKRKPLRDDYSAHAATLLEQMAGALGNIPAAGADTRLFLQGLKLGSVVEISTLAPAEGSRTKATKIPSALEFPAQDIAILRSQRNDDRTERALIFVPDDARGFLQNRIAAYGSGNLGNRPRPDVNRFEVLEQFRAASGESLFVGDVDFGSLTLVWWELWIRQVSGAGPQFADRVANAAAIANFDVHPDRLSFPDTTVIFVHGAAPALVTFASRVRGAISEIRRATGTIAPFLTRNGTGGVGPGDWVGELARRVTYPAADVPAVCLLDTGVNAGHPLLAPAVHGHWAYDQAWGADDHAPDGGHGTALASFALYGDLEPLMNGAQQVVLAHAVESMKLLPPNGFPATQPPSYGIVTQGAVSLVETERPNVGRTYCVAVSTTDFPSSQPSSWSGAVDQIAAGSMVGDAAEGIPASEKPKRLMLVATGNMQGGMLDVVKKCQPLEDPAQSWNALSIGGFTRKEEEPAPPPALTPVVLANNRSPFSRGSNSLPDDLTPLKPEVLFEAGNMMSDNTGFCGWHPAVSLLAAGSDVVGEPLVPFWATSAAVGMAGNFMGRLQAALPDHWPETLRALTLDAAQWPQPIRKLLIGRGAHWKTGPKGQKQAILREVGFGVPELERAILSARNDFTMIAEAEIQPFALGADGHSAVFNELHFYALPWPKVVLEQLENEIVTMKVTLSYFVEPNLSGKAVTRPDTYRSFGLRFAMKNRNETRAKFRSRVSANQEKDRNESEGEASFWLLGPRAVQAGSIHCDVWRGHAVDLASHDCLAIYPVGGWWKSHVGQGRVTEKGRYSLVISISAPGQAVNLHAEVASLVEAKELEVSIRS